MNTKRLAVILIAAAFIVVTLISCIALFSVKKIDVDFSVSYGKDTFEVQKTLDGFLNKNLLFFDVTEIENALAGYHDLKVVSVDKQYPNVIKVKVEERREVYKLIADGTVYVTTEDGFIVRSYDYNGNVESRDTIILRLENVDLIKAEAGLFINTSDDELLSEVFEMAKSVNLTDCIKEIKVVNDNGMRNAEFYTYTGVKILIEEVSDDKLGVDRIKAAFVKYDEVATDYQKTFKTIIAVAQYDESGAYVGIRATFTEDED